MAANIKALPHFKISGGAKLFGASEKLDVELSKDRIAFFYDKNLGPVIKMRIDAKSVGADLFRVKDFIVNASTKTSIDEVITKEVFPRFGIPKVVSDIMAKSTPLYIDGGTFEGSLTEFLKGGAVTLKLEHKYFGQRMPAALIEVKPIWSDPLKAFPHIQIADALRRSFMLYLSTNPVSLPPVNLGLIKVEKAKMTAIATDPKDPKFVLQGSVRNFLGATRSVNVALSDKGYAFAMKDRIAGLWEADMKVRSVGGTAAAPQDIAYYGKVTNGFAPWIQKQVGGTLSKGSDAISSALRKAQSDVQNAINHVKRLDGTIASARRAARSDLKLLAKPIEAAEGAIRTARWLLNKARGVLDKARWVARNCCNWWPAVYGRGAANKAVRLAEREYDRFVDRLRSAERHLANLREDLKRQRATANVDWHPRVAPLLVARAFAVKALTAVRLTLGGAEELNRTASNVTQTLLRATAGGDILNVKQVIISGKLRELKTAFHMKADVMGTKDLYLPIKINLTNPADTDLRHLGHAFNMLIRGKGVDRMADNMPPPPKLPVDTVSQAEISAAIAAAARERIRLAKLAAEKERARIARLERLEAEQRAAIERNRPNTFVDAAINWGNGKTYMFGGDQYVRFDMKTDRTDSGYPSPTNARNWPGLPFKSIDAVLNWGNGKAYVFSGSQYARYDIKADRTDSGYPSPIKGNWPGLPFEKIDAAINWGNGKAYFFSGNQYARYDIRRDRTDSGYPKDINNSSWPGLSFTTVDSVVNWGNGKAYFFSGKQYVRYDIKSDRGDRGYPRGVDSRSWPGLTFTPKSEAKFTNALLLDHKGRCLDFSRGEKNQRGARRLIVWDCHGNSNQRFTMNGKGEMRADGLCMDPQEENWLWGYQCTGHPGMRFRMLADGRIQNVNSGLCLDLWNVESVNGRPIRLGGCHGGVNQKWKVATKVPARKGVPHAKFRNMYIAANNNARCLDTWPQGGNLGVIKCQAHPNLRFTFWSDDTVRHDPQDRCINVQRGGAHGAPVVVAKCDGHADQKWKVAWSGGRGPSDVDATWRFRLVHQASGRCLEDNGGRARTVNCAGSSNADSWPAAQTWRASKAVPKPLSESNTFRLAQLVNSRSGQCADENSGKLTRGGPVIMWGCNGSGPPRQRQLWSHVNTGQIKTTNGLCLDVESPNIRRGIPIIIWGCNSRGDAMQRQRWRRLADGRLQHIQSGMCLDATNNANQRGRLVLSTCSTTATQKWRTRGASS